MTTRLGGKNRPTQLARWVLPAGWLVATAGCYGPWIAHETAALTLTGSDLAEFVKFLPAVTDGSLPVTRQLFYLPVVAIVLCAALLVGSRGLRYPWFVRAGALILAIPLSTQLLPPAWSPGSLMSAEFRLQPLVLGLCWLALAGFWLLGRLPVHWTGFSATILGVAAVLTPARQFLVLKPEIDAVYGRPSPAGWGLALCLAGLLIIAATSTVLTITRGRSRRR